MDLAAKLQIPTGKSVRVINAPRGIDLGLAVAEGRGDAILFFARDAKALNLAAPVIEAALADRLAWVAYPKAGQLDTDLNRDRLWRLLERSGIRPVRQVSIDGTWSALRFRPGESVRAGEPDASTRTRRRDAAQNVKSVVRKSARPSHG